MCTNKKTFCENQNDDTVNWLLIVEEIHALSKVKQRKPSM